MIEVLTVKENDIWIHPAQAKRKAIMDFPCDISGEILRIEGVETASTNVVIVTGTGILYILVQETDSGYECITDFSKTSCWNSSGSKLTSLVLTSKYTQSGFRKRMVIETTLSNPVEGELFTAIGQLHMVWIPSNEVFSMVRVAATVPFAQRVINYKDIVISDLLCYHNIQVEDILTTPEGGLMFIIRPEYFDKMETLSLKPFDEWQPF